MRFNRRDLLTAAAASALPWPTSAADLPRLIVTARPSVLPVGTFRATDSPRFGFRGSGFVVGNGNLLATNFHVLPAGADSDGGPQMAVLAAIGPAQAQLRRARVVATDRTHDLALLQFEGPPVAALPLAEPGLAREGQEIALIGFPLGSALGFAPVTHRGIIASITTVAMPAATAQQLDPRALSKLRDGNFEVFQLDATAYPGNSGGPVLDAESGQVVAVVNMVLVKGSRESAISTPTGISYAIPVAHLRELLRGR